MKRLTPLLIFLALWLTGCSGSSGPPVSIVISPTSASVPVGSTAQFTATVSNTSNTGVIWAVNGVVGGNATVGTISTSGLYTAPTTVPNPATVTVTAVAQASSAATASASVTILPAPSITVSPSAVTVPAGASQPFTAMVQNAINPAVTWQVNGVTGGNTAIGTITPAGVYTAPLSPPAGGSVTVTAVLQSNPSLSGSASVTVSFSNATLAGQYAFSASGADAGGFFFLGGIFTADGNGNLTAGTEDLNNAAGVFQNVPFTGTYSIGPDGRGSATFTASGGSTHFRFVLFSTKQGVFTQFDTFATAGGTIDKQDPTAFSNAALAGPFAFDLSGVDSAGGPLSRVGQFNLDGAGGVTSGVEDINSSGVIASNVLLSGSYVVSSNGRGTATLVGALGTSSFAFYVVSANTLRLIETDFSFPVVSGDVLRQQNGPYSTASLTGDYAFLLSGTSTLGGIGLAGRFTADGTGGISAGTEDVNNSGSTTQNITFTGTYSVASNGRGAATISTSAGTQNFAFYLVSPGQVFFQETDSTIIADGTASAQQGGPFSAASAKGHFGFVFSGINATGRVDFIGQLTADGTGNLTGTQDINLVGTLSSGVGISGSDSVSSNGRGTATLTSSNNSTHYVFYIANPSSLLFLGVDTNQVVVGPALQQF